MRLKKRKKIDSEESEKAAEGYAEEGVDSEHEGEIEEGAESEGYAWDYAWQWVEQNGDDFGIPKQYTPCAYFFKAPRGCQVEDCEFSHNEEIFRQEPFAACLENLFWPGGRRRASHASPTTRSSRNEEFHRTMVSMIAPV